MKKRISLFICVLVLALSVFTLGASAETFTPDNDGLYSVGFKFEPNNEYILFVLKGEYDQTNYIEAFNSADDADILYFEQKVSDIYGNVTFGPFAPNGYYNSTLVVGATCFDEPYLAGHLSAKGVSNANSIEISGLKDKYVVGGVYAEDYKIELETQVFDSFGYPSVTENEVELTLLNNSDGVYLDGNVLTIEKTAKAQAFTVVATTGDASRTAYVVVERTAPVCTYIEVYEDADMTNSVDSVTLVGVADNYPPFTVYAKTFDQYKDEVEDSYTYSYGGKSVGATFTPSVGTLALTVTSSASSVSKTVNIVAASRPDYKGTALELFTLIEEAQEKLEENVNISSESGKDVFPGEKWTTKTAFDAFASAVETAKTSLDSYGDTKGDEDFASEVAALTKAMSTYASSFKDGVRVDVTSVSITEQNLVKTISTTSFKLTCTTTPTIRATTDVLTWTSSNDSIASVDQSGNVKANASGKATITVTTRAGLTATTEITVIKKATKIELTPSQATATYGGNAVVLTANVSPSDCTDIIEWTQTKPQYADLIISEDGLTCTIVPKASGKTSVTVSAVYGDKSMKSDVTVVMPAWQTVETPEADLADGSVLVNSPISLTSATENAQIYYTLDGTLPSKTNGRLYKNPIILTKSLTLKAIAVCDGMYDSAISEYTYEVVDSSIEVSSALGKTGSTVELFVSGTAFENVNKSYITLKYNTDALTILGATALEGLDVAYYEDTVAIIYTKSDVEFAGGRYAKILFKIAEDAPEGKYVITVNDGRIEASLDGEDGGTTEFNAVLFSGVITVKNYLPGDANGDDIIGIADVLIIKQYLDGNEDAKSKIILDAADVNADGKVGRADVTLLSKYCVGWNVTLD